MQLIEVIIFPFSCILSKLKYFRYLKKVHGLFFTIQHKYTFQHTRYCTRWILYILRFPVKIFQDVFIWQIRQCGSASAGKESILSGGDPPVAVLGAGYWPEDWQLGIHGLFGKLLIFPSTTWDWTQKKHLQSDLHIGWNKMFNTLTSCLLVGG